MKHKTSMCSRFLPWFMALLLGALVAGCGGGGGRDPILGTAGIAALPPTVTAVAPVNNATGVPINDTIITAAFSEPMAPITGAASFTVTCAAPCANATGTVALDPLSKIATFTLTSGSTLTPGTLYTGTVTGAKSLATGLALVAPYIWQFTTGLVLDTTRPRVTLTAPLTTIPGPTANVPTNTAISAVFSKDMAPATINATSFTVTCTAPCVSPAGTVSYAVGSRTAVFTPTAVLAAGTTYTATITTAATDLAVPPNALAGNQAPLPAASNYVWTFTTAAAPVVPPVVPVNITVLSTSPIAGAAGVCPTDPINATFVLPTGVRMDPLSVTSATFLVTGPAPTLTPVTAASVVLDSATGLIATFTPLTSLTANVTYTATIKGGSNGVKDLAVPAGTMVSDFTWNFTVASCAVVIPPTISHLGSASTFGIMATAAITNIGLSIINGNVSLEPGTSMTGFPPGVVNGSIHINDSISHQARADLLTAYNYYKGLPPGVTISAGADLGALYPRGVPPGTYTSGSTMLVSSPLVLDAGGNAGAIWVFQIGSSLTAAANVTMLNGGSEKNVFWVPTADATVGGPGTTFSGTLVTGRDVTSDGGIINGRILAGATTAGTVALSTATVINVPAP